MDNVLVIPAAGTGSRLGADVPKWLVPVLGRPMIEWLIRLYEPHVSGFVVVVNPAAAAIAREQVSAMTTRPVTIRVQEHPTGMLDAVRLAHPVVEAGNARRVWVTWCDQVAIRQGTVSQLAIRSVQEPYVVLVLPVVVRRDPYVHFMRDRDRRIVSVRHRREGDTMPVIGESDAGLFSFSRETFLEALPRFAEQVAPGPLTGERNLLPIIPWLAARSEVVTYPCIDEREAIGINTPEDLRAVETYLTSRLQP